jgi:3-oxoacyl-[acyl-carrier-protein] synthase-3
MRNSVIFSTGSHLPESVVPNEGLTHINIIKTIAFRLGVSEEKFVVNIDKYGNTASASVLVALGEPISCNMIREGNLVVTSAFGGGLSWGANLIRI